MNNALDYKKILITGARGFIGQHLCYRLLEHHAEIHAVSRHLSGTTKDGVHFHAGSLEDIDFVHKVLTDVKPDYIFHLSGLVSGLQEIEHIPGIYGSLLTSTINILTVATKTGCEKIILVGSMEEPKNDVVQPVSPYAAAKWACRVYAGMFERLYGTPVVNPRLFMVYGPGQMDLKKLIPYVILSLLNDEYPELSSGTRSVDWVYIDDVIDALIMIASGRNNTDASFDIGSGTLITVREIVNKIAGITRSAASPLFGHINERKNEMVVSAGTNKLGWKPKISIDEGLARTVEFYKNYPKEPVTNLSLS